MKNFTNDKKEEKNLMKKPGVNVFILRYVKKITNNALQVHSQMISFVCEKKGEVKWLKKQKKKK